MIRAALLAKNHLKRNPFVSGCPVHFWAGSSTLKVRNGNKSVIVLNAYRVYSAGGIDDSKPTNFMSAGPIGIKDQGHTQKAATTTTEVSAPPTFMGKLENIQPLETCVNFKGKSNEAADPEEQKKPTDNRKKAKEAQEAAAKKLQDIVANLPSKQQTEKYFFRVVAFSYDLIYLTGTWVLHFIDQNIVQNDKVQHYWKRFHEKMEQAKKD